MITTIKRWWIKKHLKRIAWELPLLVRADVMHDLYEALDMDSQERTSHVKWVFEEAERAVKEDAARRVREAADDCEHSLRRASKCVLAPNLPVPQYAIDYRMLEKKTNAAMNMRLLEENIVSIPHISGKLLTIALLGLLLSTFGNYMTFHMKFGADWVSGSERLTLAVNSFFSLLLTFFEVVGFHVLISFSPERRRVWMSKLIGIVGALLLIVSVCLTILTRTEVGSSVMQQKGSQSIGVLE